MVQVDSSSTAIGLLFNAAKVLAEQQTNMEIESVHFMDGWVHLNMRDMMIGDVETAEEENTTLQNLAQHADIGDQTHYGHQTLDLDCGRYMGENNDYTDCDPVLTLQQTSHDQMQTIDQVSNYDIGDLYANKEINEAEIRVEINYVRPPSPITSSLQSFGASSSHYEYQSSSMIAGEFDDINDEIQSSSITSQQPSSVIPTQPSNTAYIQSSTATSTRAKSTRATSTRATSTRSLKNSKPKLSKSKSTSVTRTTLRRQPPRNALSLYASHPYHRLRSRTASFNRW